MKRVFFLSMVCVLSLSVAEATAPPLPVFPPLHFKPTKPQRFVLSNGLVVFLLEDHELPLIHAQIMVRAGSQYDSPEKVGLSSLFGPVMTQGGSLSHKPEEIQRILDVTGASLSFGIDLENGSGGMSCKTADFDRVFEVFSDLWIHPQFEGKFLSIEKDKALEGLRRLNDDPSDISRREFRAVIYGKSHPYARIPTPKTISGISRKDLLAFHQQYFKPNASYLAVSGDFETKTLLEKLEKTLAGWPRLEVSYPEIPRVIPTSSPKLYYIQRPINQSQIRIGHTGFARRNPDRFAWEVFNELWGGSATSELFRIIRTQKGLAYAVGSAFSEPGDLGLIVAVSQTRGPETIETIQAIQEIDQRVRESSFSQEEIQNAKEAIRNRFIENYTSSAQIAQAFMNLEYFGYPSDYLDTFPSKIAAVTPEDLKRVAQTYLHPDKAAVFVVGDLSTFKKPFSTLGKPIEIKLTNYAAEEP